MIAAGAVGSIAWLGRHPYVVVHELRREVSTVRPHKGLKIRIDLEGLEDGWVAKRLEHWSVKLRSQVDSPAVPSRNRARERIRPRAGPLSHRRASWLLQGLDHRERLASPSSLPVCHQLLPVETGPFKHEPASACRKLAPHVSRLDLDRDLVLAVHRMEVRGPMLVEEHTDHDAEKLEISGLSRAAHISATTDRQRARAWAPSGPGGLDDTVVPIHLTLDELDASSQHALDCDSRHSAFEERAQRRMVHAECVVRHVVVQHHPWAEYADQQVSGAIIEITNPPLKLANLRLRELPRLILKFRPRTWS